MNLVLIGMPGCGKSTVGVVLAKAAGYAFIDTDLLIQQREGRLLQQIIDERGIAAFLQAEEAALCTVCCDHSIIATGGSAVYSERAMQHLGQNGKRIYLSLSCSSVERRLGNLASRGVAGANEHSITEIYAERLPLYQKYADVTINCEGKSIPEIVSEIQLQLD